MSILLWAFDSRPRALGGLGVPCETRGEPCLLVSGGGGGGGVLVGGDEVQYGPRNVYSDFNTVFLPLLLLAAGVGFPAACF